MQSSFHIGALFHVNPYRSARCGVFQKCSQVRQAKILIQIEPELRQLDGDFHGKVTGSNTMENLQVMLGYSCGLALLRDVFSEMSQNSRDIGSCQIAGGAEGIFETFTRKKAPYGTAQEIRPTSLLTHPPIFAD